MSITKNIWFLGPFVICGLIIHRETDHIQDINVGFIGGFIIITKNILLVNHWDWVRIFYMLWGWYFNAFIWFCTFLPIIILKTSSRFFCISSPCITVLYSVEPLSCLIIKIDMSTHVWIVSDNSGIYQHRKETVAIENNFHPPCLTLVPTIYICSNGSGWGRSIQGDRTCPLKGLPLSIKYWSYLPLHTHTTM